MCVYQVTKYTILFYLEDFVSARLLTLACTLLATCGVTGAFICGSELEDELIKNTELVGDINNCVWDFLLHDVEDMAYQVLKYNTFFI